MRTRTFVEVDRHLQRFWKPLHGLSMHNVRCANLTAELGTIAKRSGPGAANRSRASLSALFRWAIGEGLCNENPATAPHIAEAVLNHLPAKLIRTYDRNA